MEEYLRCDVCSHVFSSRSNLTRHKSTVKTCKSSFLRLCPCGLKTTSIYNYNNHISNCVIFDYERIIKEKDDKLAYLNAEMDEQALELDSMKKQILELKLVDANKEGQIKVYKETPQSKTTIGNQYINPKLINIKCDTIRPFTIETVKEEVGNGSYTYDHFLKGASGLANFIAELTIKDDQRSYVCTDSARNKFHRLLESRKWKDDNGATFLNNVLDELIVHAESYYTRIVNMTSGSSISDEDKDFADSLMLRTRPLFFAIRDKKSDARIDILNKIRSEVKKLAAI